MEWLTWMLAGLLRTAARLLPPMRREWAEAVRAEVMMVLGPLLGAAGGALGGAVAADHPRKPRPARSWAAGLFVRS